MNIKDYLKHCIKNGTIKTPEVQKTIKQLIDAFGREKLVEWYKQAVEDCKNGV